MNNYFKIFALAIVAIIAIFFTSCKKDNEVKHPYAIGQSYGGGIIFYIDGTWEHGLICASVDQGLAEWGCDLPIGGTSKEIGTGKANTLAILNKCGTSSIAAGLCDQYSITVSGQTYNDWFLPSLKEMMLIYQQGILTPVSGVAYWSSSEYDDWDMYVAGDGNTLDFIGVKQYSNLRVMPIRNF
jgi:hypothetical protein